MNPFLGFVGLGGNAFAALVCKNSSGVPVNPDAAPSYRVYGPGGLMTGGTGTMTQLNSGSITGATNASPIQITSGNHGLNTGTQVTITGVAGNTAANGTFTVTKVDANNFTLDGSTGNGAYTSGGTWNVSGLYSASIPAAGANGFVQGTTYTVVVTYAVSSTNYTDYFTFTVV